ncbi:MAG: DEAD/DEAH box helicase [Candidatus Protochlamydia sp.]|nr:DEAD/DEAH box helicase [Candidatus Protochlamydia sp.]
MAVRLASLTLEGYSSRLVYPSFPASRWKSMAKDENDKQAFQALFKEEAAYRQRLTGRTPQLDNVIIEKWHISALQAVPALKLLAMTRKLYFNNKALIIDFMGRVDFYYEILGREGQSIEIKPHLKWRDTDIAISECDCIGPGKPVWFVKGISLKGISTSLSWKELLRAFQTDPWLLDGPAKKAFLEEIDFKDTDTPQIILKGMTTDEVHQQNLPNPVLMLKDRTGAFADLCMDYGQGMVIAIQDPRTTFKNKEGSLQIRRQLEAEKNWEKDLLETDFIKKSVGSSHYYCPLDKVAKSLTFLLEIGWSLLDWQGRKVVKQESIDLSIEDLPSVLSVKGKVVYQEFEADASLVLGAFNRRERFVQLNNETVGLLPELNIQNPFQELLEEGEIVGQEIKVKKNHFGSLSALFNNAHVPPSLASLKEKWDSFTGIQQAQPGPSFVGALRPYQQEGLNWLAFLKEYGFHGILADEMGLGKTVQILALLSTLPTTSRHLIIVPTSLLFNWKNEIHRFLPALSCLVHQGPQRTKDAEELKQYATVLTSYTTLRLDLPLFQEGAFYSIILDEAQMIKNAQTQVFRAVCSLPSQLRLCLTGTPIENHLGELWSHFHFLIPDLFGSEEGFSADIQASSSDKRYLDRIKKKIAPFILRRRKIDVAKDLPPRIDQTVWIEMSEAQRKLYDQFLAKFKGGLLKKVELEGMGKHRLEILEAILRLRQLCCHPLLVSSLMEEPDENPLSAKFEALTQDLETLVEEGRKVLVYSQFTTMLKLMSRFAASKGWSYAYLDGSTADREKVVTTFQEDPEQFLFFISLKAGGVGLNLTAADYVLLYDPWWNEAVEEQAINRAHRIGRQDQVIAKRYVVLESIEEKMMKLKAAKKSLVEDIFDLDSGSGPAQLTLEDLKFLLA